MENPAHKVILITGCSSGFGLRTAARLSAGPYNVIASMRDLEKKNNLLGEVEIRQGRLELLRVDITDIKTIKEAVNVVKARYGRLDVLVNNAGYGIGGFFEDLTQDEIRAQMETNFFGVQNITREVLPLMRQQGSGLIINISSVSGLYGLPCFGAYNASKWALEGFSESLFYELLPFGIKVCLIEPGVYKTKIFYENRRYASRFFDQESPYYEISQVFQKRTNDHVKADNKDPEEIAILIENIINDENPSFRNIPDMQGQCLYLLKRFLPFRLFSWVAAKVLYRGVTMINKGEGHAKDL